MQVKKKKQIHDTVTGGSVLASGAEPPARVTNPVVFVAKCYCYRQRDSRTDRVKYGGSTLPKNN